MKKDAEEKKLPPIYRGKWARASAEEVEAMGASGAPYCYRFRVPEVRWGGGRDSQNGQSLHSWEKSGLGEDRPIVGSYRGPGHWHNAGKTLGTLATDFGRAFWYRPCLTQPW
jgi:hypothetical protein